MEKFQRVTSRVIPLPLRDVDTDMIIPAQFLTSVSREGFAANLFRRLKDSDPNFPLNRSEFKDASILVADSNFGCGSSREHAVWAICGAGIKVVIAKSFADIFSSNSLKNGLLIITLPVAVVDSILAQAQAGDCRLSVDLESQQVTMPDGAQVKFEFDPFRRHCLLSGLDDVDYLLSKKQEIDTYRETLAANRFFDTTTANR